MKIRKIMALSLVSIATSTMLYGEHVPQKMDSITVTANKIEENIQDIPQSITVIDAEIIQEKGINDISGVIKEIPNMTGIPDHGMMVNFRGLNTSMFTNNNPVVIYIDGVPLTDRMGYDISMANAQRVEVLRGPQGTLYGKDAIGGVINIVTKEPENEHSGSVGAEYSSFNTMLGTFNINGPLMENELYYGINAQVKSSDGWVTNQLKNDDKANKTKDKKYSTYLLYKPTDSLSTKLTLSKLDMEKHWGKIHSLGGSEPISSFNRDGAKNTNFDVPTLEKTVTDSQSLNITYELDDMVVTSVTTHKKLDLDSDFDMDFGNNSSFADAKQFNYTDNKEITEELRVASNKEDLKWVAGLYVDDSKRDQGPYGMQMGGVEQNAVSRSNSDTKAVFAQSTFPIASNLDLTLGARYQKIKKDIDLKMYQLPIGTTGDPSFTLQDEKTWSTFIPKLAMAYKLNKDLTPFVSISRGYMPGGYNYFSSGGTASDNSFEPQISTNYEAGIKGMINHVTFTASVFRMDIKDVHIFKQSNGMWLTDNAKKAHSQGIEFDFNYFPSDEFEISGAFGFIDAKYDDYDASSKNYNGERIENTPKHTANLSVAYYDPRGYYGRADLKNGGSVSFFNSGNQKFEQVGGYTVADIKVGYKFLDYDIYGFVKNITDEEYITTYKNNGMSGIATFNDPRSFGIGAKYNF